MMLSADLSRSVRAGSPSMPQAPLTSPQQAAGTALAGIIDYCRLWCDVPSSEP